MDKSKNKTSCDVLIIGAGAAGLMCAVEAGKRHRRIIVLEHNDKVGRKIRISGGGRCNFTNIHTTANNFISNNPHFCKSALARYTPGDFCRLVERHGIAYHEKKLGQLFCDHSAQDIIDMLLRLCQDAQVQIILNTKIKNVKKEDLFIIETNQGIFEANNIVVACGGLSIPSLGTSSLGYQIAQQFGLNIIATRPGLVPLTLDPKELKTLSGLSGVSVPSSVTFEKQKFEENILFTHKGLSGPAILQISSYWKEKSPIHINLLPHQNIAQILKNNQNRNITLKGLLSDHLPKRFVDCFCEHYLQNKPLNQYTAKELQRVASTLTQWAIVPNGSEGYAKAEVTVAGVDTNELSSQTMECKKIPGLYFIGEVVDVTGHLGGYNFQWAWASGFAAGNSV